MSAKLIWATRDAVIDGVVYSGDDLISYIARVSSPENQSKLNTAQRLLRYLIRKKHWSPFEMVNACVEVSAPRDITRQLLRHRSFSFQEFSGRYAAYSELLHDREARLQDTSNRQNSVDIGSDEPVAREWQQLVDMVRSFTWFCYQRALSIGIAKEVARVLLPEGLVPTKLYVNGTLRSWIHYWNVRLDPSTQKEHRELAEATREAVLGAYPGLREILIDNQNIL